MIIRYSVYNDRYIIYEGAFREIPSHRFKIGDWFLTHHICTKCNVPIMEQIKDMRISYYFNGLPIYDFIVHSGSSYKSNLLHCSLYDQIVNKLL